MGKKLSNTACVLQAVNSAIYGYKDDIYKRKKKINAIIYSVNYDDIQSISSMPKISRSVSN